MVTICPFRKATLSHLRQAAEIASDKM